MAENKFISLRHWVEPAHPGVIKLHDDLVAILTRVRDKYQGAIDKAFDQVSRQIGFVVTTTLPVVLEVLEGGKVAKDGVKMGAKNLQDTIFSSGFKGVFEPMMAEHFPAVAAGTYRLQLIWLAALKLRLPCDWCEPAHVAAVENFRLASQAAVFDWGPVEPPQWFDPGLLVSVEEAVLIHALDNVYPQLRLIERIGQIRASVRTKVGPHIPEPAHPQAGRE